MKNILIVGGRGALQEELKHRLRREGHHVFLLTNGRSAPDKPSEYVYPYDSDSIHEVLDSANPDTIILLGAYDPAFNWHARSEHKSHKAYLAGLTNILFWAEATGVHRVIYLSSECVFEEHYFTPIDEGMESTPRSPKGIAVSMGESIVKNYASHHNMDLVILRLAHMYMIPTNRQECDSIYTQLCLQAVREGKVRINAKIKRSALYLSDAVQAVFQMVEAPVHQQILYHVVSDEVVTEDYAVELIRSSALRQVTLEDRTVGMEQCILLTDHYFSREFSFQARNRLADTIPLILRKMQSNLSRYFEADGDNAPYRSKLVTLLTRLIPYMEAILAFFLVLLAEYFLGDNAYFARVDFFLLYALLFSLMHGLQLSIFTSSLCVLGAFLLNYTSTDYLQLLMDVSTYVWIAQMFTVSMSVGHLRNRLIQIQTDKNEEIDYLTNRLHDISDINKSNSSIKAYFEQQTINSTESLGYFYDLVTQLDNANDNEVIFVAVQMLANVMGTRDVAIYHADSPAYCRLLASLSDKHHVIERSLKIQDYQPVFDALETEHVFINRQMDDSLPLMASSINNKDGKVEFALFLWNLPYERMTLHYSNTLRIVTMLIRSYLERSANYLNAITNQRYWTDTGILRDSAFRDILQVYENARKKKLADYALLTLEMPYGMTTETSVFDAISDLVKRQLRQLDYVGYLDTGRFYILLANTNQEGSQVVIRRLVENGLRSELIDALPDDSE